MKAKNKHKKKIRDYKNGGDGIFSIIKRQGIQLNK